MAPSLLSTPSSLQKALLSPVFCGPPRGPIITVCFLASPGPSSENPDTDSVSVWIPMDPSLHILCKMWESHSHFSRIKYGEDDSFNLHNLSANLFPFIFSLN